jgi:malonate transporter and related proteins
MTEAVLIKLLAIMATVVLGWLAAKRGWLGPLGGSSGGEARGNGGSDPALVLSNTAFYLFVPALLFRTMARQDLQALPWRMVAAYFVPALAYGLAVYLWQRLRPHASAAAPATRTVAAVYGNAVQLGIPLAAALFGETGLALHIALVSVHGLVLLTLLTVLVEADLARQNHSATRWDTLRSTVRNTLIHPVVLPIVLGLVWNLTGLGLHPVVDQTLQGLGSAVVPVCLVLIGVSLASYGLRGGLRQAVAVTLLKLMVLPALVLAVAWGFFGLTGTPLAVLVMMAALPVGSNALIFAQRYDTLQAEATVAIVVSTVAFTATAALWLAILAALGS